MVRILPPEKLFNRMHEASFDDPANYQLHSASCRTVRSFSSSYRLSCAGSHRSFSVSFRKTEKRSGEDSSVRQTTGYEPPYGDGTEVLYEEFRKDILLRGKEEQIKQLEQQVADLEVKDERNETALNAMLKRGKELEDQLQQATDRNVALAAQAREEAEARVAAADLMEMRILNLETEKNDGVKALEEQLQQAAILNSEIKAQADEQAQAHRITVEQMEESIRSMEAERCASVAAFEQRVQELEEQLQQAAILNNEIMAKTDEQVQVHRIAVEQMEERIRSMDAERSANMAAIEQRAQDLDDQLQQATARNNEIVAQAAEQAEAHRNAVEQMEERMRSMDAENNSTLIALQQRVNELEDQLQQASLRNNEIMAQSVEQALVHRTAIEQMQQLLRSAEDEMNASRQRMQEVEEQLQQTSLRNSEMMAQAREQEQTHRATVEKLELRMRDLEAENSTRLTAMQQQARELEEQLQQASQLSTSEASITQQEALERSASMEQLNLRIRELESEINDRESRVQALQAQVKDLGDQLRLAADRSIAQNRQAAPDASKTLLRRAEWMTACAVGAVRTLGLVAAEAYAAAAVAADAQDRDAQQLLVELTKLRSGSRGSLPSVAEAVTTFDERSADFFGADLAGAARLAEREALDRYQSGLNQSALLVTNFSLALHKQLSPQSLQDTRSLQEMRAALLARLGRNATRPAAS